MPCSFGHSGRKKSCQFIFNESEIVEVATGQFCPFHLPLESKKKWNYGEIETFNDEVMKLVEEHPDESELLDLEGIVFPGDVDFSGRKLPTISFVGCEFGGMASFGNAQFTGGYANFGNAQFTALHADFKNAQFTGGPAYFPNAQFTGGNFDFENAQFIDFTDRGVSFENTQFTGGPAYFANVQFTDCGVSFENAQFTGGHADFENAQFTGGPAYFESTKFTGDYASFENAQFTDGYAHFANAQFTGGHANFENTQFTGGQANFENAQFTGGNARFRNAQFTGGPAIFSTRPMEEGKDAFHGFDMSNAIFVGDRWKIQIDFTNRKFTAKTNFSNVTFPRPPMFHGCELHQDTNFDGAEFPDTTSEGAARAYRTLKLAMEKVRSRQEEALFYALEQKSLRAKAGTHRLMKLVSWLYEKSSDFGQSFARPLIGLALVTLCSWFIYLRIAIDPIGDAGFTERILQGAELGETLRFALAQLFRPFSAWTATGQTAAIKLLKVAPGLGLAMAAFQSLASLVFLGLLTLAVRWRFRRG